MDSVHLGPSSGLTPSGNSPVPRWQLPDFPHVLEHLRPCAPLQLRVAAS